MSFVGLDNGEYREGQFGVDKGVAFADANSSETRYFEQLEQMKEDGVTFADLGIDPKDEKYGPNGLLGTQGVKYDVALADLQAARETYEPKNLSAGVPDSGISDEERFVAAAMELESRGVEFDLNNKEYYNDDNTPNYSALAAAAEAELASLTDTTETESASLDTNDGTGLSSDSNRRIIDTSYNGNQIHYDPAGVDDTVAIINGYIEDLVEIVNLHAKDDSPLDDRGKPYRGAGPRPKALSSYSGNIIDVLERARDQALKSIDDIVAAVCKYNDGDASLLTKLLSGGGGGGGGGDPSPSPAPTFDGDDDLLGDLDNLGDEIINEPPLENQEPSFDENEKLVIPGVSGGLSQKTSTSTDSSLSSVTDETLKLDGSSDIASSLDNVGTSFFGTDGKFIVPSVSSTSVEKDKVNSAGVVGGGAVLAAASLAVGGKIYHDKKNEAENSDGTAEADDELIDNAEDSDEKDNKKEDEKDNTDDEKNNKSIFKSSGVKFKESILDDGGDL